MKMQGPSYFKYPWDARPSDFLSDDEDPAYTADRERFYREMGWIPDTTDDYETKELTPLDTQIDDLIAFGKRLDAETEGTDDEQL